MQVCEITRSKDNRCWGIYKMDFYDKTYYFEKSDLTICQLQETFDDLVYQKLNVKGKVVIDLGSNIGDTPIYFVWAGAKKVYGFECDKEVYDLSVKNVLLNNMQDKIHLFEGKVEDIGSALCKVSNEDYCNMVLKIDIEHDEFDVVRNDSLQQLDLFDSIIMEYHDNPETIISYLETLGFKVETWIDKKRTKDFNWRTLGYILATK